MNSFEDIFTSCLTDSRRVSLKKKTKDREIKLALSRGAIIGIGILIVLIFLIIVTAVAIIGPYNRLTRLDVETERTWAEVNNHLLRRSDLIPNLVETVKGYAAHEKELFERIAAARAALYSAPSPEAKIQANTELSGFLGRLLAIAENYPNLKANESFNRLLDELAGTENRIAVERKRYNDGVLRFNQLIRKFPVNLIAQSFDFQKGVYFEAPESKQEVPKVAFK